jgi:acyl carrier protein
VDRQVKIRGFRVEPGEVEAALLADPRVREALVAVRGAGAERHLAAWVVAGGDASAAELKAALRARVPEHLVPAHVVRVDAIPLNANGKFDLAALPDPARAAAGAACVPARSETERVIASVWREALDVDEVGREESFFELGGHSLLAVGVQRALESRLGRQVALLDLFSHPTVAALAAHLDAAGAPRPDESDAWESRSARRTAPRRANRLSGVAA